MSGSRGAVTGDGRTRRSQATAKMRLGRGRGEMLVFCIVRIYNMVVLLQHPKTTTPHRAGNSAGRLTHAKEGPMRKLSFILPVYYNSVKKRIPQNKVLSGILPRLAVQS
jgi:hypothetical protein